MYINENWRDILITFLSILCAAIIVIATNAWGKVPTVDYNERHHQELLLEIAMLESGNRNIPCAYAYNCTEIGVYQYKPETWALFQKLSGMYWLSIYDEQDQRHMTDFAIRNGLGHHWTTFKQAEQNIVIRRYK